MKKKKRHLKPIAIVIFSISIFIATQTINCFGPSSYKTDVGELIDSHTPMGVLPEKSENISEIITLDMSRVDVSKDILDDEECDAVVNLDYSMLNKGLVFVSADNIEPRNLRISIYQDFSEVQSCHRIFKEGYYPLINGEGIYYLQIFIESSAGKFSGVAVTSFYAEFDEVEPFKYSNYAATYYENSPLTQQAFIITKDLDNYQDKVSAITRALRIGIVYNIEYYDLAEEAGDCDTFYERGEGICYHFSALFSAMMRSIGIPTREVRGSITFGETIYHSWNEYYSDGEWHDVDVVNYKQQKWIEYIKDKNSER